MISIEHSKAENLKVEHSKFNFEHSPEPIISKIQFDKKHIFVVRDDLLESGTKQRAAIPYISSLAQEGYSQFVYASPFSGFAQIALAYACSIVGTRCVLFCEKSTDGDFHLFSKISESYGAEICLCENLSEAHERSIQFLDSQSEGKLIPLGFNDPLFKYYLKKNIQKHWKNLTVSYKIKELWLPIGSGTLLQTFKEFIDEDVKIYGVNVNILEESDQRIFDIKSNPRFQYIKSSESFHDVAKVIPPIPSNSYYDAKLFSLLKAHAKNGAFWWNVAK